MRTVAWALALSIFLGGCRSGLQPEHGAKGSKEVEAQWEHPEARLLRDPARAAEGAGAGSLHLVDFGAGVAGDSVEGFVALTQDECLVTYARAPESVEDLDLYVYGDDGAEYGSDESPDDLPTLLVCPKAATRLFVSARIAQGRGMVALGAQVVPEARADDVGKAVGARGTQGKPTDAMWPGMQEAVEKHRAELGGSWIDLRRVALPLDSRVPTHVTGEIPERGCLDALLLPSPEVSHVQMAAQDGAGRTLSRSAPTLGKSHLSVCSSGAETSLTFEIRPYAGRGLAVLVLSVLRNGSGAADLRVPAAQLGGDGDFGGHPEPGLAAPSQKLSFEARLGQIVSKTVTIEGCARVDGVRAGATQSPVLVGRARVWNESGDLLADFPVGAPRVPGYVCGSGPLRFDVEAESQAGRVDLEIRKSPKTKNDGLQGAPLAAGRLLTEAQQSGFLSLPADIGLVTPAPLHFDRLSRFALSIPAGHCRTVFAAKGPGGYGIEARIFETKSGEFLDEARGSVAVTTRACAPPDAHLDAVLELRSVRGESAGLWASRQEKL